MSEEPQCAARDTSIEGRLGDLENTVRNEQEVQRRYWRAVEQDGELADRERDRLVARVKELEELIEALECGQQQDAATQDNILNAQQGLLRRIEALGTKLSELDDEIPVGLRDRLVELEDWMRVHRDADERERQERWHRTRDAVLQGLLANHYTDDGTSEFVDDAYADAVKLADRAHGPLEANTTTLNELTPKLVQAHADEFAREWLAALPALVRATTQLTACLYAESLRPDTLKALGEAERTLKPFEGVS